MKPDFIVCGFQKCGTTSLHDALSEHPEVCMSKPKEPDYFTLHWDEDVSWYHDRFGHCADESLVGEVSVSYSLYGERTPRRIKDLIPDVQIIFVVRDPVERAFSSYWHGVKVGTINHEKGKFFDLISGRKSVPDYWHPRYDAGELILKNGLYHKTVLDYQKHFGNENVKVLLFEELFSRGIKEISEFLGIKEGYISEEHSNKGRYLQSKKVYRFYKSISCFVKKYAPSNIESNMSFISNYLRPFLFRSSEKPEFPKRAKNFLIDYYRKPNKNLYDILEKDLSHWQS